MEEKNKDREGRVSAGQKPWWQPALFMFFRLSSWIVVPVLAGIFLGKWLDRRYGTTPWLFLTTVGVAFVVSMAGLVKNTLKEYKKIDKNNQAKNKK